MPDVRIHITQSDDGVTMINGERLIRTEWVSNTLTVVTPNGEYCINDVPLDQYLALLDLGDE